MSNRKGCPEHHEAIAAYVMDILPAAEAAALRDHLKSCEPCRQFLNNLLWQEDDLRSSFDNLPHSVQTLDQSSPAPDTPAIPTPQPRTAVWPWPLRQAGRVLRAHPRFAVAAMVLAGLISLFTHSWRAGQDPLVNAAQAAYVAVLHQIEKAHSVRYTKTVQNDGEEPRFCQQMVKNGGRMRSVSGTGPTSIDNFVTGDELQLYPKTRTALLFHSLQSDRERFTNMVDWTRTLHERDGVFTGQERLDGVLVDVYRADRPYEKITVWADATTNLPVRVVRRLLPCTDKDIRIPYMELEVIDFAESGELPEGIYPKNTQCVHTGPGLEEKAATITLSDFAWNTELDDSLFDLTPPEGYKLIPLDQGNATDDAASLVGALRFWAEMSTGHFPENINMLADARPLLIRRYLGTDSPDEAFNEALPMFRTILGGMSFAESLKVDDNWHYDGKNVRLGQADKPLAWWQDRKTTLWQVVYGDLRLEELAAPPRAVHPE